MKRKKIVIRVAIASFVILMLALSAYIPYVVVRHFKVDETHYTSKYYGKIQSYLDVYKDIWNASVPEEKRISKAVQYENPIISEKIHQSGFCFYPIYGQGDIYEEREFSFECSYNFELDFFGAEGMLDPYFTDRVVNCVVGFGSVHYKNQSKFSESVFANVMYIMLECDSHIAFFSTFRDNSVYPKVKEYKDYPLNNVYSPFSISNCGYGFEDYKLLFMDLYNPRIIPSSGYTSRSNFTDTDSLIIGLDYGRPINYTISAALYYEHLPIAWDYYVPFDIEFSFQSNIYKYFTAPKVNTSKIATFSQKSAVVIPCIDDLISNYVVEYRLGYIDQFYDPDEYFSYGWRTAIDSYFNKIYGFTIPKRGKTQKPSRNRSFAKIKCIPFGDENWRPCHYYPGLPKYSDVTSPWDVDYYCDATLGELYFYEGGPIDE